MQEGTSDKYKIGYTEVDPRTRLTNLQTGNSVQITIAYAYKCPEPHVLENIVHKKFHNYRVRGEWFQFTPEVLLECDTFIKVTLYDMYILTKKVSMTPFQNDKVLKDGEIMFRCIWCGKTFAHTNNLYRHKKSRCPVKKQNEQEREKSLSCINTQLNEAHQKNEQQYARILQQEKKITQQIKHINKLNIQLKKYSEVLLTEVLIKKDTTLQKKIKQKPKKDSSDSESEKPKKKIKQKPKKDSSDTESEKPKKKIKQKPKKDSSDTESEKPKKKIKQKPKKDSSDSESEKPQKKVKHKPKKNFSDSESEKPRKKIK
jgi:uncharacterized C2H2 Zn-finger protein